MKNAYVAFYRGKEIVVWAETAYAAQKDAVTIFGPPKSQAHMVHVHLAEQHGDVVFHSTAEV